MDFGQMLLNIFCNVCLEGCALAAVSALMMTAMVPESMGTVVSILYFVFNFVGQVDIPILTHQFFGRNSPKQENCVATCKRSI